MLMTIPFWGPEFSVSFEFSLNSHCVELTCTMITFSSSATDSTTTEGDKIPATFASNDEKVSVFVAKDSGYTVSKQVQSKKSLQNVKKKFMIILRGSIGY